MSSSIHHFYWSHWVCGAYIESEIFCVSSFYFSVLLPFWVQVALGSLTHVLHGCSRYYLCCKRDNNFGGPAFFFVSFTMNLDFMLSVFSPNCLSLDSICCSCLHQPSHLAAMLRIEQVRGERERMLGLYMSRHALGMWVFLWVATNVQVSSYKCCLCHLSTLRSPEAV